jgi:hypothetical protein
MRQVTFKTNNNQIITFNSNNTTLELNQEQPYGIGYRLPCTSTLSETEINEWWDYVDQLLIENPEPNFYSVWRIIENGSLYGYEN